MTSGEQCVMTPGTALMLLLCANNWDMHTLEVSADILQILQPTTRIILNLV